MPLKKNINAKQFILDESFSQMLFRKIDEKGLLDVEVYKKAGVSKQVFSNIKNKHDRWSPHPMKQHGIVSHCMLCSTSLQLCTQNHNAIIDCCGSSVSPNCAYGLFSPSDLYGTYCCAHRTATKSKISAVLV